MAKYTVVHHRRYGIGQVQSVEVNFAVVRFARGSFACNVAELNRVVAS